MSNLQQTNPELVENKNYQYCLDTIEHKKAAEGYFLDLGERLARIRQREMYRPAWDSFGEYVAEMGWSEGTASKLITVWMKMVQEWNFNKEALLEIGSWDTLYRVCSQSKTSEEAASLIEQIQNKLPSHRNIILTSHKKGTNPDTCTHPNAYIISTCPDCGERHRVMNDHE